jgi:hypothetical protein
MSFPRPLRAKERDLLETVLPGERPGYRRYRELLSSLTVIGEGRRGEGNLVLGGEGDAPDLASPLSPVVAYGVVETTRDLFTVTVREEAGGQLDVEIVSRHGEQIPDHYEEKSRWTYSLWNPGDPSPASGHPVREITVDPARILVIAQREKRLWVHDRESGMNLLIPITNFYNEIMLHKKIRDPETALHSEKFFEQHESYSDADLRAAFVAYNAVRHRVTLAPSQPEHVRQGLWHRLTLMVTKGTAHG